MWGSIWKSIAVYVPAVFSQWVALVLGAVGALVGLVLNIFADLDVPTWAWIALGLGTVTIAQFLAFHKIRLERDRLKMQLEPRMEIQFENKAPYETTVTDQSTGSTVRLFCVGIKCIGTQMLTDCVVYIQEIRNSKGDKIWNMPVSLTRRFSGSEVFPLRPGQDKLVKIASLEETRVDTRIMIHHTYSGFEKNMRRDEYELTIKAYAGNTVPCSKVFKMFVGDDRCLKFHPNERHA